MGYHPETLITSIRWLGVDIWHVDPERPTEGQRTDDSCKWFDRTPGEYATALREFINDTSDMHDVRLTLNRRKHAPMAFYDGISKPNTDADRAPGYPRLSQADTLAVVLMIARTMERSRWWRARRAAPMMLRPLVRIRNVSDVATDLALSSVDNLSSVETPESLARLIAAALNRHFKPWWRHPRWHLHHWKINVALLQRLRPHHAL